PAPAEPTPVEARVVRAAVQGEARAGEWCVLEVLVENTGETAADLIVYCAATGLEFWPYQASARVEAGGAELVRMQFRAMTPGRRGITVYLLHEAEILDERLVEVMVLPSEPPRPAATPSPTHPSPTPQQPAEPAQPTPAAAESALGVSLFSYTVSPAEALLGEEIIAVFTVNNTGGEPHSYVVECGGLREEFVLPPGAGVPVAFRLKARREPYRWEIWADGELLASGELLGYRVVEAAEAPALRAPLLLSAAIAAVAAFIAAVILLWRAKPPAKSAGRTLV
ncbi:MAG: hypothetical protein DRN96_09450, partial [Thermoproteota archaeon]